MKISQVIILGLFILVPTVSTAKTPKKSILITNTIKSQLPKDSGIMGSAKGQLNSDSISDIVIIISEPPDRYKNLRVFIFEGKEKGKYDLVENDNQVLEMAGLGIPEVNIKNNVIELVWPWNGVGRDQSEYWIKFRKDSNSGRYVLIGEDYDHFDSIKNSGSSKSLNHLTGKKISLKYTLDSNAKRIIQKKDKLTFKNKTVLLSEMDFINHETLLSRK